MRRCRKNSPYRTQAIWLRLYPCDVRQGYNTVYVEAFADSQVLLPPNTKVDF